MEKGGDINIEDFEKDTPLYVAETLEMARFLIDKGADAKHENAEGISPAQNAHEEGWQEVAKMLAEITKEELPSLNDQIEQVLGSSGNGPNDLTVTASTVTEEEGEEDQAMDHYIEDMVRRIQEQGGVQNEEELREAVTKMVLEQLQNSFNLSQ